MMKILISIVSFLCMTSCVVSGNNTTDFAIIYDNLYKAAISNPKPSDVEDIISAMNADGSFQEAVYIAPITDKLEKYLMDLGTHDSTDFDDLHTTDLRKYLKNLTTLAAAYKNPKFIAEDKTKIKEAYFKGVEYWITKQPEHWNWWFNYIAYPQETWKGLVLMSEELSQEKPELFKAYLAYQTKWYEDTVHTEGANGVDMLFGGFPAYVVENNITGMMSCKAMIDAVGQIQSDGESIEADYMYGAHSGSGRQIYQGNYGAAYVTSILNYQKYTKGTLFDISEKVVDNFTNYFINSVQWTHYKGHNDPNIVGRFNSTTRSNDNYVKLLKLMIKYNPSKEAQLAPALSRLENEAQGLSQVGNKYYWRFDYMVHRTEDFYISSRMTSTRTVGAEAGNITSTGAIEGWYNYYAGAGVTYMLTSGQEYAKAYFDINKPLFNHRQFPGITAEQDDRDLLLPLWGKGGTNASEFAGGVSDGINGACGMFLSKRGLSAHKGYFFFDKGMVALGAGITQNNGTSDVYTTLNQDLKSASLPISYKRNGKTRSISEPSVLNQNSIDWVQIDDKSYFMLDAKELILELRPEAFSLAINHGTKPKNATYAYIVTPHLIDHSDLDHFQHNMPVKVLSNTSQQQAVLFTDKNIIQAIFYEASTLDLGKKTITVDTPCVLMISNDKEMYTVSLSDIRGESSGIKHIKVTLNEAWELASSTHLLFEMPQGIYAGSTVTKKLNK